MKKTAKLMLIASIISFAGSKLYLRTQKPTLSVVPSE